MKRNLMFSLFVLSLAGCFVPKQTGQAKQTFTFDYTPKQSAQSGSAGMLFSLLKPYYAEDFTVGSAELFKNFREALGDDAEELISSKGLTMKGPYLSFDEMIFEDKKSVELLIKMEITPRFTAHEGNWRSHNEILGQKFTTYSYSGKVSLIGKINLSGIEPLTGQLVWVKSVQIPNVENISIETANKYKRTLNDIELLNDPNVYNAIGKALKLQYAGIMDKIAAHFSVEEFKTLKSQIKELKSKKGF